MDDPVMLDAIDMPTVNPRARVVFVDDCPFDFVVGEAVADSFWWHAIDRTRGIVPSIPVR
ncbi:hypothetical protein GCM10009000_012750 [Halobacterium noricense]